LLVLLHWFGF